MHEMKSTQPDRSSNSVNNRKTVVDFSILDLPFFDGDDDGEIYLDWERRMESLFNHKQLEDHTRFSYATLKLTRYASL